MKIEYLIMDFYDRRIDMDISHVAADLYIFLLREVCSKKSSGTISVSTERVCMWLRISRNTLLKARKELQSLGLVTFLDGKGSSAPEYTITACRPKKDLCISKCTQNFTQQCTQNDTQDFAQNSTQNHKNLNNNNLQASEFCGDVENQIKERIKEKKKKIFPPAPPIKENKKENNKEKIYNTRAKPVKTREEIEEATKQRAIDFYNSLIPYLDTYGKEMLREFFDYWSEPNKSYSKMRFETEKTWDLSRRLARWANNNRKNYQNGISKQDEERRQRAMQAAELIQELDSESDDKYNDPYYNGKWDWRSQLPPKVPS